MTHTENKCSVEATVCIMHVEIAHEMMPIVDENTSKIKGTKNQKRVSGSFVASF